MNDTSFVKDVVDWFQVRDIYNDSIWIPCKDGVVDWFQVRDIYNISKSPSF